MALLKRQLERAGVLEQARGRPDITLSEEIDLVHQARRRIEETITGASSHPALMAELVERQEPTWKDRKGIEVDPQNAEAVARQMFRSSGAKSGETIVIQAAAIGKPIVEAVVRLCTENNVDFEIDFQDDARQAVIVKHLEDSEEADTPLKKLAALKRELYRDKTKLIKVGANADPEVSRIADPEKDKRFKQLTAEIVGRLRSGEMHYILTYVPTEADAGLDGMGHADYVKLFFEACDQPWKEIETAQEILKAKLDEATEIHITNEDGTDLALNIEGQTFANSVVGKNLPGSELFSSPQRDGVNGTLVAKGRFQQGNSGIIEDITLKFVNGRIAEWNAKTGKEALGRIITQDDNKGEGSRRVGEIGIGTNPHLRRQFLNPLLVEKVGGSFHLAIGSCYTYTTYGGRPVALRNGNVSEAGLHWDLTTLLRGKNGAMTLKYPDNREERVQQNGEWLVEGVNVLNQGWAALPESRRPDWFNQKLQSAIGSG